MYFNHESNYIYIRVTNIKLFLKYVYAKRWFNLALFVRITLLSKRVFLLGSTLQLSISIAEKHDQ
jgi:hypothetical protein